MIDDLQYICVYTVRWGESVSASKTATGDIDSYYTTLAYSVDPKL